MLLFLSTFVGHNGRLNIPHIPFSISNDRSASFLATSCALLNFYSFGLVG
ncbi:hypothetical protein Hanom_Chr14g01290341 [Helianthus anomalus]